MKSVLLTLVTLLGLYGAALAVDPHPGPGEAPINNPHYPPPHVRPYYPQPVYPYYVVVPGRGGYWVYPSYPRPYYPYAPAPYPYYPYGPNPWHPHRR